MVWTFSDTSVFVLQTVPLLRKRVCSSLFYGQDKYQQFGGSFESIHHRYNIAHVRPCSKNGPKNQNLKQGDRANSFLFHSIRLDEQVILVYSFVKIG